MLLCGGILQTLLIQFSTSFLLLLSKQIHPPSLDELRVPQARDRGFQGLNRGTNEAKLAQPCLVKHELASQARDRGFQTGKMYELK